MKNVISVNTTIEQIMQNGFDVAMGGTPFEDYDQDKAFKVAVTESKKLLHSLLISKLPEKIEWDMSMDMTGREADARNSAIDDMRKSIDELFGVKG